MSRLAPEGPVYQAGTLSGNPLAMAAGIATLKAIRQEGFYQKLEEKSAKLSRFMQEAAANARLTDRVCFNRVGSMLCCFFTPGPVTNYTSATASNTDAFSVFFRTMLTGGIYIAPSQYEAMFVSIAHTDSDIARTAEVATEAFKAAAKLMQV
jgi:glutamate-1-semialdehyde 2,1-aminomutase